MDLLKDSQNICQVNFGDFCKNIDRIKESNGDRGVVIYTGNRAFVYFDETPKTIFYIISDKAFQKENFLNLGENFDVIGRKSINSIQMFKQDIKNNIGKIVITLFFYLLVFNPYTFQKEVFLELTDQLIDIISIFIGMVFVFIGFFYGDKERTIEVYKKGRCDEEFSTDRYILLLAFISIIFLVLSNLLTKISLVKIISMLVPRQLCDFFIHYNLKDILCVFLVYLAIINILICFDSLINYYLKTMRNKYLIDAIKEIVGERKMKS